MDKSRISHIELDGDPSPTKPTDDEVLADESTKNSLNLPSSEHFPQIAVKWLRDGTQPLPTFARDVNDDAQLKVDVDIPMGSMVVDEKLGPVPLLLGTEGSDSFWGLDKPAAKQLGARVGVPTVVVDHLLEPRPNAGTTNRDLAAAVINRGLADQDEDKTLLVRGKRDKYGAAPPTARAILSQNYAVLDNDVVVNALDDIFRTSGHADARVSHLDWDGSTMDFNLVLPQSMTETAGIIDPETDSPYLVSFHVRNDERGRSSVRLEPGLIRAICLNGIIHGYIGSDIKLQQRHSGAIDAGALTHMIANVIQTWGEKALVREILEGLSEVKKIEVPNVAGAIVSLVTGAGMPKRTVDQWITGYNAEVRERPAVAGSAFAVVQGLSRASQDFTEVDQRREAEKMGGTLILPKRGSSWDAWRRTNTCCA